MSRLSKFLLVSVLLVFVLACNMITQPIDDVQNLAGTAESIASSMPLETLQSLATSVPVSTLEALPDIGEMFDPQGTPVTEWNGIPIMPQATAGQEFADANTYSFKVGVTVQEVKDYYDAQLPGLGWSSLISLPVEEEGGVLTYSKDSNFLTITISMVEGTAVVVITLV